MSLFFYRQVSEILKPNGIFLSITFAQPHFRLPLYAEVKYGWSIETKKFGTDFAYFLYIITKGMPLNMDQIQKYLYCIAKSEAPDEDVPVELPENSLSSIDLF